MNLFTMVSNEAFIAGAERKLNDKELYLLIYMSTEKNYKDEAIISYDVVFGETNLFDDKNRSRHKTKTKAVAESLHEKGYINLEDKGKYMKVAFNHIEDNFTQIFHSDFEKCKDNTMNLYILGCVAKWRDGAVYAYSVWAELLEVNRRRAIELVDDAVSNNIIYKLEGKWDSKNHQQTNKYSINPFALSGKIENGDAKVAREISPKLEERIVNEKFNDIGNAQEHGHQWFSTQRTNFTVEDFKVYLTTNDEKIKASAEKHIARISKTEKGANMMNWLKNDAMKEIEAEAKREADREHMELMSENDEYQEYETSYKPKEKEEMFFFD